MLKDLRLSIIPSRNGCGLDVFQINGKYAHYSEFGEGYDAKPDKAPLYGCGDRKFRKK